MTADIIRNLESLSQDGLTFPFHIEPMPGEDNVFRLTVEGQPEFPIAISEADGELLCMVRLFGTDEIVEGRKGELYETMLAGNLTLPLSTFGVADNSVYLFGSLSGSSSPEVVVQEIQTLAGNTLEALELVREFLV